MGVFEAAIGWLAPAECVGCGVEGSSLCTGCILSEVIPYGQRCFGCGTKTYRAKSCSTCRSAGAPNYVWVSTDYEATIKQLLQKYKYTHQRAAAVPIAQLMVDTLMTYSNRSHLEGKDYLIVPVPTATKRLRQRSFDHTQLLAEKIAGQLQLDSKRALGRLGQSRQVGAKRSIRASQIKGCFYALRPSLIRTRNILLVDDVVTTGATLQEAARVLRAGGARSVDALVLAKKL